MKEEILRKIRENKLGFTKEDLLNLDLSENDVEELINSKELIKLEIPLLKFYVSNLDFFYESIFNNHEHFIHEKLREYISENMSFDFIETSEKCEICKNPLKLEDKIDMPLSNCVTSGILYDGTKSGCMFCNTIKLIIKKTKEKNDL
ncbi:hypothetical protein KY334_08060 [Candidatus Woesearchaeota archaeon]|nr:hypothetical protein [Candidatus Woesearchaeota archaeon]